MNRRQVLSAASFSIVSAIAGCIGDGDQESDESGDNSNGENVDQSGEYIRTSSGDTSGGSSGSDIYRSEDYYGLPECNGRQPIQLIDVQGNEGIISNPTTDDYIVAVMHDDDGYTNGDFCGWHLIEAASQTAYETFGTGEPDEISIEARLDTRSNRDAICDAVPGGIVGGDGCVDPDTIRG